MAVIGRLAQSVSAKQAEAELSAIQAQLNHDFSDEPKDSGVLVVNLQQDNTRTIRSSLLLLLGAVGVLLLIACVNTGSLILGRNAHRMREFAVRVALGCSTRRLLTNSITGWKSASRGMLFTSTIFGTPAVTVPATVRHRPPVSTLTRINEP